jgi:hypothetical protein
MLVDPADRVRVELLLRVYADIEGSIARHEQRTPASFDFLRKELGLPV